MLFITPLLPLSNFVGHPHWDAVRWIPFQDFSLTANFLVDVLGNTAWFMIFGYLLHYWTNRESSSVRAIATVTLIGAAVSLSLESFQIFCHNRIPSLTDVACNIIGASLGAYIADRHQSMLASKPVRYLVIEDDGSKTLL
jgi:glycopeptide antibiotics resistance protein